MKRQIAAWLLAGVLLCGVGCGPQIEQTEQGASAPEGAVYLFDRAKELAEHVSDLPAVSEVSDMSAFAEQKSSAVSVQKIAAKSVQTIAESDDDRIVDLSDPEQNKLYRRFREGDGFNVSFSQNSETILHSDGFIDEIKRIKEDVMKDVIMLGTWVSYIDGLRQRLTYDPASDVAVLEQISEYYYANIRVTETADGRDMIRAYEMEYRDGAEEASACDYVEGESYTVVLYAWNTYQVVGCDLTSENKSFFMAKGNGAEFHRAFPEYTDLRRSVSRSDEDGDGAAETHILDGCTLYDDAGKWVGGFSRQGATLTLTADVYALTGWDRFAFERKEGTPHDGIYVLECGGVRLIESAVELHEYDGGSYFIHWAPEPVAVGEFSRCLMQIWYEHETSGVPRLILEVEDCPAELSNGEAVKLLLDTLGFSFKSEAPYRQMAYSADRMSELIDGFSVFGYSGADFFGEGFVELLTEQIMPPIPSDEEVRAMLTEPAVPYREQTPDDAYFYSFNPSVSAEVAVTVTEGDEGERAVRLSPKEVALTLSANAMAGEGSYALVLALVGDFRAWELGRTEGTFESGTLELKGLEDFEVSDLLGGLAAGDYRFVVYLAREIGGETVRASKMFDLHAEAADVLFERGDMSYRFLSDGEALRIHAVQAPTPPPDTI